MSSDEERDGISNFGLNERNFQNIWNNEQQQNSTCLLWSYHINCKITSIDININNNKKNNFEKILCNQMLPKKWKYYEGIYHTFW